MIQTLILIGSGICYLSIDCSKKKEQKPKKNVETARTISSPSPSPLPSPSPSQETTTPSPSNAIKQALSEFGTPESGISEVKISRTPEEEVGFIYIRDWLEGLVRNSFQSELREFDKKEEDEKQTFKAFDKNARLNRFKNPKSVNDEFRVILKNRKNDYINATWMHNEYILTQGPLSNTITDFWAMICQENVEYIVMFCSFVEKNVEQCAQYYPLEEGKIEKYEEFEVRCVKKEKDPVEGVTWTILDVTDSTGTSSRTINHIYVSWWPDKTAPEDAKLTIELYRFLKEKSKNPIVCHCDSGIGRSACFVAFNIFLKLDQKSIYAEDSWKSHTAERLDAYIRKMRNGAIDSPILQLFLLVCLMEYCIQEMAKDSYFEDLIGPFKVYMEEYKKYNQEMKGKAKGKSKE